MIYIAPASATYKITKGNREIKQRLMELSRTGHACGYRVKRLTAAFTSIAISINRLEHDSIISTIPDYVYKRRQEASAVALLAGGQFSRHYKAGIILHYHINKTFEQKLIINNPHPAGARGGSPSWQSPLRVAITPRKW